MPLTGKVGTFAVAPNGQKVAVAIDPTVAGRFDLWVMNADGSGALQLAAMPAFISPAVSGVTGIRFSPDGQKIAFLADQTYDNARDVYVVPVTGGLPVKVSPARPAGSEANTALGPNEFVWSRDSAKLAITGDFEVDRVLQLYLVDAVSPGVPLVVLSSAQVGPAPAGTSLTGANGSLEWTAAGRLLFKAKLAADTGFHLYGVDGTGANLAVLPNFPASPAQLGAFGLSPDGATLAFSADTLVTNAYEVYKMPATGASSPLLLTLGTLVPTGTGAMGPIFYKPLKWSPDGLKIAFIADTAVDNQNEPYVVPASGGGEVRLVVIGGATSLNQDCEDLFWSPDSTQLAFYADHRVNNDGEAFVVPNVTTPLQTPTLVQGVVTGGDVFGMDWTP